MKKRVIYINLTSLILLIFFITILVSSISKIGKWRIFNKDNESIMNEINEIAIVHKQNENIDGNVGVVQNGKEENSQINFEALKEMNSDCIGWLEVPGTEIKYSVVKSDNNSYYLNHNFKKEYNYAGWIFADYTNNIDSSDRNLVIYGHNVRDNSMFTTLKNVIDEEWYNNEENYNITFSTENSSNTYRVFSVYKIEAEDYYIKTDFEDDEEFGIFVETLQKRSLKNFEEQLNQNDSILTLSTCANNNKYRVVLHAKKIS